MNPPHERTGVVFGVVVVGDIVLVVVEQRHHRIETTISRCRCRSSSCTLSSLARDGEETRGNILMSQQQQ
jgi:hypothetical protein